MSRRRRSGLGPQSAIVALVVLLGAGGGVWLASRIRQAPPPSSPPRMAARATPDSVRPRPVRPAVQTHGSQTRGPQISPSPRPLPRVTGPRVAIVFDDAGGSLEDVEEIVAIGRPVTVAVLPGLAHSSEVARRARVAGLEVILHLPIESTDDTRALGPGGVTMTMDDAQIRTTVRSGLQSVPGAIGVNNHMGSKGTADRRLMSAILEVVRERGLFFLDSRTTTETVAESMAADMGIPTVARTMFLDNVDEEDAIRGEVQRLITLAVERGTAIAIGHAQKLTPRVVARMLKEFDRQGVTIVPLSTLVR